MLSLHKIAKKYSPLLAIFPRVAAQPVAAAAVSKNSEQRVKLLFLLSNTSSHQPRDVSHVSQQHRLGGVTDGAKSDIDNLSDLLFDPLL